MGESKRAVTPEQAAALISYAQEHGRLWRHDLRKHWERGEVDGPHGAVLYALRNTHGPSWLTNYQLPRSPQGKR